MAHKNDIKPFKSIDELSVAVAELILDTALKSIAERGKFTLVLSGGKTPELLYTLLASPPYATLMPWKNTFIFWGDERCVPLDDERNNAHNGYLLLLKKVPCAAANIYRIPVNLAPQKAALVYQQQITDFFGSETPHFDFILLGLGEDGHTASLFPQTEVLNESQMGVRAVFIPNQEVARITLTAPLINQARTILFMVTGQQKKGILNTVLNAPPSFHEKYPAQLINPVNGRLYWFTDIDLKDGSNKSSK